MDTDKSDQIADEQSDGRESPVCLNCMTPHDPLMHFCPRCGATVGQLTIYMPFEGIHWQVDFFSKAWSRVWHNRRAGFLSKVFCLFMIVVYAPIMLLGLPFILLGRRRKPKNNPQLPDPTDRASAAEDA